MVFSLWFKFFLLLLLDQDVFDSSSLAICSWFWSINFELFFFVQNHTKIVSYSFWYYFFFLYLYVLITLHWLSGLIFSNFMVLKLFLSTKPLFSLWYYFLLYLCVFITLHWLSGLILSEFMVLKHQFWVFFCTNPHKNGPFLTLILLFVGSVCFHWFSGRIPSVFMVLWFYNIDFWVVFVQNHTEIVILSILANTTFVLFFFVGSVCFNISTFIICIDSYWFRGTINSILNCFVQNHTEIVLLLLLFFFFFSLYGHWVIFRIL